jgi:hypothetical protein
MTTVNQALVVDNENVIVTQAMPVFAAALSIYNNGATVLDRGTVYFSGNTCCLLPFALSVQH